MGYKVTGIYVGSDLVRKLPTPITTRGAYHNAKLGIISVSGDGSTRYTIADKNLGATKYVGESGATSAEMYGNYYQWGNNYGFPNTGAITTASGTVSVSASAAPGSYSDSTFRTGSTNSWMTTFRKNLRGDTTDTYEARRGPCPEGYHIWTRAEWIAIYNACDTIGSGNWYYLKDALLFIKNGNRSWSDGSTQNQGSNYMFRTSSAYTTSGYVYRINGTSGAGNQVSDSQTVNAFGIRPMKNEPVQPTDSSDWVKLRG